MNKFTEAFDKARDVFNSQEFAKEWNSLLNSDVKPVLKQDGPDMTFSSGLNKLRAELRKQDRGALRNWVGLGTSEAAALAQAANESDNSGSFNDRAAALKMLTHLYLSQQQGSQNVWIYAPPKSYAKWVFEELQGTSSSVRNKLKHKNEVYSESERKVMCAALAVAHKWASDASVKLAADEKTAKRDALIRDWFGDEDTTDAQIKAAAKKLQQGFNKIAQRCAANKLVFSDEPNDRKGGGWKDWAFVYKTERLDVIYLQGAFLKAGNSGKTWKCALTIVHELTHIALDTYDYQYDDSGLKPGKDRRSDEKPGEKFNHSNALKNADSWAYFAADLAGALSKGDKLNTCV